MRVGAGGEKTLVVDL